MIRAFIVFSAVVAVCSAGFAQHGTAGSGYYPVGYNGDTWTGEVSAVNDTTREITLLYRDTKHHKTESFVVELPAGYQVHPKNGEAHNLKPSDIPIGTRVIVYYMAKSRKVQGVKTKYYEILRISNAPSRDK